VAIRRDALRMLDYLNGTFNRLDVGFVPSPSGGFMCLLQQEEVHDCLLVIDGYAPDMESAERHEAIGLITAVGFVQTVFGYPNEEAFAKDPRGHDIFYGCYEIVGSQWESNVNDYNERTYGNRSSVPGSLHHFFVGSHDASCQVLARDLRVEIHAGETFRAVLGDAQDRMRNWRV